MATLKNSFKNYKLKNILFCLLGTLVYSLGFLFFLKPANLYTGGFLGVAQLLSLLTKNTPLAVFDVQGILYFLMNIPLIIIGSKKLGMKFMTSSIICIVSESIALSIIPTPALPIIDDTLANCILGGCIEGIGTAISFNAFASGGGTDILGMLLCRKFKNLTVGKVSLFVNIIVYVISAFLFSLEVAIFSFVASFMATLVTDHFHKQNNFVIANIITEDTPAVKEYIIHTLDRAATEITGQGAYSKSNKTMVIAVMSEYELTLLERDIKKVDPKAFIFIQRNASIIGNFEKRFSEK